MIERQELEDFVTKELSRRKYSQRTVSAYASWVVQISDYFADTMPEEISMEQIEKYLQFLTSRKRAAPRTIKQAIHAFHAFFNEILDKGYPIKSLSSPKVEIEVPEILSPGEIVALLNSIDSLKHRVILALIYSAGLEVSEAVSLRISDIDFQNGAIYVSQTRGKGRRKAILSKYVSQELKKYLTEYQPRKWLFEGRDRDTPYTTSGVQKALKRALRVANIDKDVSPRNLRHSYIKHLESQGIPLSNILQEMAIFTNDTYFFYGRIEEKRAQISHSPLDHIVYGDDQVGVDVTSLERMLLNVQDEGERDYLLEAVKCIKTGAYRAGVVFAWTAAILNIRNRCIKHSNRSLNTFVQKHCPKAPPIKKLDDFAYVKDRAVLEVSRELGEFDKNEGGVLIECLNLRNKCGHPGKYKPKPLRVAAFIEDLITIVFGQP